MPRDGGFPTADQRQFGRRLARTDAARTLILFRINFLVAFRDILVLFSMKTLLTLAMAAASSTALTTVGVSGARLITYCVGVEDI